MKCIQFLLLALIGCTTSFTVLPMENGSISAHFCEKEDCLTLFTNITIGQRVSCAIYHLDEPFLAIARERAASLVVDEGHPVEGAVMEHGSGLMHDKFCIIGGNTVWTGSWNPAQEMEIPNNIVIVQSKTLANAYQDEFDELSRGTFHGGQKGSAQVILNGNLAEAYFCPEDKCETHVLAALRSANSSIHFMTFSFTDDKIGDLLKKKALSGLDVKGIFDSRIDKYSEYEKLKEYAKKGRLHHKVFIIDGRTVITGSYNPTKSADERNDENVIILQEPAIADAFEAEFNRLYAEQ